MCIGVQEGFCLLSKIKQLLDPHKEEQWEEDEQVGLVEKEINQLHTENEQLRERISQLQNKNKPLRMHIEFFYFHPNASPREQFSEQNLDHLPMMCVTIHFMDKDKSVPHWMSAVLAGLEDTLSTMKVQFRKVDEPHLYSIFVDTKLYPHQEVKKVFHLLAKQLNRLHRLDEEAVTVRVHVGGDQLYNDLLDAYQEQAMS